MSKKVEYLSLILPEDVIYAFISKWVIQALFFGNSNLPIILRYRITQLQPSSHGPWGPSSSWLFSPQFSTKGGSKVWHRITQLWKVMARTVAYFSLSTPKDFLQINLWWRMEYEGSYFGIIMSKAYTLVLRYFRVIWDLGKYNFLNSGHVKIKFSLEAVHQDFGLN